MTAGVGRSAKGVMFLPGVRNGVRIGCRVPSREAPLLGCVSEKRRRACRLPINGVVPEGSRDFDMLMCVSEVWCV